MRIIFKALETMSVMFRNWDKVPTKGGLRINMSAVRSKLLVTVLMFLHFGAAGKHVLAQTLSSVQHSIPLLRIGDSIPVCVWHLPMQTVNSTAGGRVAIPLHEYRDKPLWPIFTLCCLPEAQGQTRLPDKNPAAKDTTINTTRESSRQLTDTTFAIEEVEINTGYQRIPKERATGSFEHIDQDMFTRNVGLNVLDRLDGITNSVLFDRRGAGVPNIQIRGLGTLHRHMAQPLIVLDQFPYEGDILDINPDDIESLTILKDAAASSIWEARAANGVIVINTKKGTYNQPTRISASANVHIVNKPDLSQIQEVDAGTVIDMETFLFQQGHFTARINNRTNFASITPVVELLVAAQNGSISEEEATRQINILRQYDVRKDFEAYIYRPTLGQTYSADISGGGNRAGYRVSIGHDISQQELVGNDFNRTTLRSAQTFRPLNGLEIHTTLAYTRTL